MSLKRRIRKLRRRGDPRLIAALATLEQKKAGHLASDATQWARSPEGYEQVIMIVAGEFLEALRAGCLDLRGVVLPVAPDDAQWNAAAQIAAIRYQKFPHSAEKEVRS